MFSVLTRRQEEDKGADRQTLPLGPSGWRVPEQCAASARQTPVHPSRQHACRTCRMQAQLLASQTPKALNHMRQ